MRRVRAVTCFYLLKSGDILNPLCYGYMYKDFIYVVAAEATEELYVEEVQNEEIQLSTATAVTEQTQSYIWSLIVAISCGIYYCCTQLVMCIGYMCMTCCCNAEQKIWCLKCMYCCRHLCFLSIILFLICLDWLY